MLELALRAAPAGRALRQLDPWFTVLRERNKEWFFSVSLWLLLGTQSALAIEAWRDRRHEALRGWIDAWAEFEALNSLAGYAYENPEDCWPEVVDQPASLAAEELGHPLIARHSYVRNDFAPIAPAASSS